MRKTLKVILIAAALVAALFLVTAYLATKIIKPEQFKQQITQYVQNQTGLSLQFEGPLRWSFFPWIGLAAENVHLKNPAGFENTDLAHIAAVDIKVRLIPLFSHRIEIGNLILDKANLTLIRNKEGQSNWTVLQNAVQKHTQSKPTDTTPATTSSPFQFAISQFTLHDGQIRFDDQRAHKIIMLSNLQLNTEHVTENKFFPLNIETDMQTNAQMRAHIHIKGRALINTQEKTYSGENLTLTLQLTPSDKNKQPIELTIFGSPQLNTKTEELTAQAMEIKSPFFDGQVNLKAQRVLSNPNINGHFNLSELNGTALLKALGNTYRPMQPDQIEKINVSSDFAYSPQKISFQQLNIQMPASHIQGQVDITPDTMKPTFNLNIDRMNADDLMPQPAAKTTPTAQPSPVISSTTNTASPKSATSTPSSLNLNGQLRIGTLHIKEKDLTDVQTTLVANQGIITMSPLSMHFQGATFNGKVMANIQSAIPQITVSGNLSQLSLATWLKNSRVSGTAQAQTDLKFSGNDKTSILNTLNGTINFRVTDAVLQGVDLVNQLDKAYAFLKRQPAPATPATPSTRFGQITGTANISQGIVRNSDLLMSSDDLHVTGDGNFNLLNNHVSYHLLARAMHRITNTDGSGSHIEPRQTPIPILVTGTIDKPIVIPDFAAIAKLLIKDQLQGTVKEQVDKLIGSGSEGTKKLGEELKKTLNLDHLFH